MGKKKEKKKSKEKTGGEGSYHRKNKHSEKLDRSFYEKELTGLQVELVKLQAWVRHKGLRIVVVFEGRDAAGKGGIIKRITERVSSRVFRIVSPCRRPATAKRLRCISNVIPNISPPPVKWCFSIAAGTTGWVWSG
jgi:polyphosphate kinase 2 (PPK2 family)